MFILDLAYLKHLVQWVPFGLETWLECSMSFRKKKKTLSFQGAMFKMHKLCIIAVDTRQ